MGYRMSFLFRRFLRPSPEKAAPSGEGTGRFRDFPNMCAGHEKRRWGKGVGKISRMQERKLSERQKWSVFWGFARACLCVCGHWWLIGHTLD